MLPVEIPVSNWIVLILALLLVVTLLIILKLNHRITSQYRDLLDWTRETNQYKINNQPIRSTPFPRTEFGPRATDADEQQIEELRRNAQRRKEQGIE